MRQDAASRKGAGSISDNVTEVFFFFNLPNPSSCTMAFALIQPQTEMSTTNLLEGYSAAGKLG
jgi:hypothetical protein